MRHRLLGHRAEPALESPRAATAKNLAEGSAAIAKGKSVGAKTQRERDYIDALAVMYADHEKVDHRTRIVAYAKAMEQVAQSYPKDDEAQIHYALSLNTSASPADKTYANQLKGAAMLEPIVKRQPQPSRRGALSDPPLRLSADRGERPRCRAALCQDRARRAARAAHAVAYLHARRLLEGIDRVQRRVGARREAGQLAS